MVMILVVVVVVFVVLVLSISLLVVIILLESLLLLLVVTCVVFVIIFVLVRVVIILLIIRMLMLVLVVAVILVLVLIVVGVRSITMYLIAAVTVTVVPITVDVVSDTSSMTVVRRTNTAYLIYIRQRIVIYIISRTVMANFVEVQNPAVAGRPWVVLWALFSHLGLTGPQGMPTNPVPNRQHFVCKPFNNSYIVSQMDLRNILVGDH